QNQPRRDDFGLKIGKLSHRTSIKDGLGRHIGSCGPLNRNFLKHVDGVISKRVSLGDIKALWQILMSQTPQESGRYNVGMTTRLRTPARLSSEEASVLRGYSCNLKTKQIARQLGCNVRLVYFYKNNAMNKLKAVRGPSFYQSIRWILN
ncbi:LuxR C-terminal-related transcriptional regulator, partial [Enterobacter hormaechei]|uniref:LuxR C-terminal-related transcriptional regulator n=1 Tax=Enterobacter hormaechei TaxID=158836 RepID=UPI003076786B